MGMRETPPTEASSEDLAALFDRLKTETPEAEVLDETKRAFGVSGVEGADVDATVDNVSLDREYTHNPTAPVPDGSLEEATGLGGEDDVEAGATTHDRHAHAGPVKSVRPAQPMPNGTPEFVLPTMLPGDWFRARADLQKRLRRDANVMFTWEIEEVITHLAARRKPGEILRVCAAAGLSVGERRLRPVPESSGTAKYVMRISKDHNMKVLGLIDANDGLTKSAVGLLVVRNILVKYGYMTEDGQIADPYPELRFET